MTLAQGEMRLECVSLPIPAEIGKQTANPFAPSPSDPAVPTHDFWLVLNVGTFEMPLIPTQTCTPSLNTLEGVSYTFTSQTVPDAQVAIVLPLPGSTAELEDLDSLEVLLRQYGCLGAEATGLTGVTAPQLNQDMKGKLVLVNEETGEMVGELDQTLDVVEDKKVGQGNHDKPVMLDFGDVVEGYAPKVVVQTVPESEMDDWLLKSAHYLSKGILGFGDIASRGITSGADLFIKNTKAAEKPVQLGPRTKAGIRVTHNTSVKTVKVAKRTIGKINDTIQGVVEKGYGKTVEPAVDFYRRTSTSSPTGEKRPAPPIPPKPSGLSPGGRYEPSPPPYTPGGSPAPSSSYPQDIKIDPSRQSEAQQKAARVDQMLAEQNAALGLPPPPPRAHSPQAMSMSPTSSQQGGGSGTSTPKKRPLLNRLLLAGEVVLTSLEATAHNLIDSGTSAASSAAGHKFGPEAGHATHLLGGSVRNVAVVYIDARGIGRKALLKGTAKGFVKARLKSGETVQLQGGDTVVAVPEGQGQGQAVVQVENGEAERKGDDMVVVGMPQVGRKGGPNSAGPTQRTGDFGAGSLQPPSGPTSAPPSAGGRRNLPPTYADKGTLDMIDRY